MLSFLSIYQLRVSCWFKTIWLCWVFSVYINPVSAVGLKLFDFVEFSQCISTPCQLLVWNYLILLTFLRVYISPVSAVGMKLFDFVEYVYFVYISCLYETTFVFDFVDFSLCIYQPRVSCWFETIWLCWVFSVYICSVSVVGLKLFGFVEYVSFVYICCLYETIWFCWLFSVYISAPCQLLLVVGLKLFYFVEFSQYISAPCQLLMIIILRSYMFRNKKILCYICKS